MGFSACWEKKRKTRIWWESLFTFMYQQISLRRRRNITRVSNVWKAAPIRLFRLGPQRTQRNNGKVFRIFLQPDWQIDNGFFYHTSHGAQVGKQNRNLCDKDFGAVSQTSFTRVVRRLISANPGRLRVVSLFSCSVEQNARDTKWPRAWLGTLRSRTGARTTADRKLFSHKKHAH